MSISEGGIGYFHHGYPSLNNINIYKKDRNEFPLVLIRFSFGYIKLDIYMFLRKSSKKYTFFDEN